jgi:hydrogenase maturation protein HypF
MPEEWQMVQQALDSGLNSPLTSSMGRLFDAVSAYLGLCLFASYEGQGAVLLENAIQENIEEYYNYYIDTDSDVWQISLADTWRELVSDKARGESTGIIASRFHNTIAALVMDTAVALSALSGICTVALSGGVWQNIYLLEKTKKILEEAGFKVLIHHKVPTNDSGIAYGQAAMAMYKLKGEG